MADLALHGCALTAPLASPQEVSRLRAAIDPLFAALNAPAGIHLHANRFLDQPRFADAWNACLDLLTRSPAMDLLRDALGPDLCVLTAQSLFRLVTDGSTSVPWHQDCDFTGNPFRIINCWVPLCDTGTTAPGLEVARKRFTSSFHKSRAASSSVYGRHYLADTLEEITGEPLEVLGPHLAAGSVLMFDQYALHRTQPLAGRRVAVEIRCASSEVLDSGARDVDGGGFEPVALDATMR